MLPAKPRTKVHAAPSCWMSPQVLLRKVTGPNIAAQAKGGPQLSSGCSSRMHLARLDLALFGELERLMRIPAAGGKGVSRDAAHQYPLLGLSSFHDEYAVVFLPMP